MKNRIYAYWSIAFIWCLVLTISGVEGILIGLNTILILLMFVLNELCNLNDK